MGPTSRRRKVTAKGILLETTAPGEIRFSTAQGDFAFDGNAIPSGASRPFLDGRVSVEAVPPASWVTGDDAAEDFPSVLETSDRTLWLAYQSYDGKGDRVWVRRLAGYDLPMK